MCKIVAICNQKGGVGKTTTSINLGIGLVRHGRRVLLVDFDPQGNATQGLGYELDQLEVTISDVLHRIMNKDFAFASGYGILRHEEGIDLMPANIDLSYVETELFSLLFGRETVLKKYLQMLRDNYDYILIDCSPSLNLFTTNTLVASDQVLIPLEAQKYSVRGLEQLFYVMSSLLESGLNDNLKIVGLLYTLVKDRTKLFREIHADLEAAYGSEIKIFDNYIPCGVAASQAPNFGKSVYSYMGTSRVAMAYEAFTEEFLRVEEGKVQESGYKEI